MSKDLTVNYYRIEKAIGYLTANFRTQPDLDEIAEKVNLSPFYFQRMFLDWVGLTPKKFKYNRHKMLSKLLMLQAFQVSRGYMTCL